MFLIETDFFDTMHRRLGNTGLKIRHGSDIEIAFPKTSGHHNVSEEDARHRSRCELGLDLSTDWAWQKINQCPKRDPWSPKVSLLMPLIPSGLFNVYSGWVFTRYHLLPRGDLNVASKAMMPYSVWPPLGRQSRLFKVGTTPLVTATDLALCNPIGCRLARRGRSVTPFEGTASSEQLGSIITVETENLVPWSCKILQGVVR